MIPANIDAFRQIGDRRIHFKAKVTSSAAQMSGVNDDCYIHYYIQEQNASIAESETSCLPLHQRWTALSSLRAGLR